MNKCVLRGELARRKGSFWVGVVGVLWVLMLVGGCASSGPSVVASVSVSPNPADVAVNRTRSFSAVAKDAAGNVVNASFVWSSGDTAVASINASTGVASGIKSGNATITATAGGVSGSAALRVFNLDGASVWDSSLWDSEATWGE